MKYNKLGSTSYSGDTPVGAFAKQLSTYGSDLMAQAAASEKEEQNKVLRERQALLFQQQQDDRTKKQSTDTKLRDLATRIAATPYSSEFGGGQRSGQSDAMINAAYAKKNKEFEDAILLQGIEPSSEEGKALHAKVYSDPFFSTESNTKLQNIYEQDVGFREDVQKSLFTKAFEGGASIGEATSFAKNASQGIQSKVEKQAQLDANRAAQQELNNAKAKANLEASKLNQKATGKVGSSSTTSSSSSKYKTVADLYKAVNAGDTGLGDGPKAKAAIDEVLKSGTLADGTKIDPSMLLRGMEALKEDSDYLLFTDKKFMGTPEEVQAAIRWNESTRSGGNGKNSKTNYNSGSGKNGAYTAADFIAKIAPKQVAGYSQEAMAGEVQKLLGVNATSNIATPAKTVTGAKKSYSVNDLPPENIVGGEEPGSPVTGDVFKKYNANGGDAGLTRTAEDGTQYKMVPKTTRSAKDALAVDVSDIKAMYERGYLNDQVLVYDPAAKATRTFGDTASVPPHLKGNIVDPVDYITKNSNYKKEDIKTPSTFKVDASKYPEPDFSNFENETFDTEYPEDPNNLAKISDEDRGDTSAVSADDYSRMSKTDLGTLLKDLDPKEDVDVYSDIERAYKAKSAEKVGSIKPIKLNSVEDIKDVSNRLLGVLSGKSVGTDGKTFLQSIDDYVIEATYNKDGTINQSGTVGLITKMGASAATPYVISRALAGMFGYGGSSAAMLEKSRLLKPTVDKMMATLRSGGGRSKIDDILTETMKQAKKADGYNIRFTQPSSSTTNTLTELLKHRPSVKGPF